MFIEGMQQCISHFHCLWKVWISALVIYRVMEDTEQCSISHLYLLTTLSLLKTNFSSEKSYIYLPIQIIIHSSNCAGHCAYEVE